MLATKPYLAIPIRECGEPMVALSSPPFALQSPHPYVALGAPYGESSPWMLRRSIAESLLDAQTHLSALTPQWRLLLIDAYRPNAVQAFMVEREFAHQAEAEGYDPAALSVQDRATLSEKVFRLWGFPSEDPATPPPHSTGAAFDCTLLDETGCEVWMGSAVDENSKRSLPDYFAQATDEAGRQAHANRTLLHTVLSAQGMVRHPAEWWHFSRGDQMAVWNTPSRTPDAFAIYGRAAPRQAGKTVT